MHRHLLLTISNEASCHHGLRFVSSFFRNKSQLDLTLVCVEPNPSGAGASPGYSRPQAADAAGGTASSDKNNDPLQLGHVFLCERGFDQEDVNLKLLPAQLGTAKDIIREGRIGSYDAVVLGRRGYNVLESVFNTSVSREIMDQEIDFPVWICRHPERDRNNVLLCCDGSEPSLRMADHVGFMLKKEDHRVTIFHVDTGHDGIGDHGIDQAKERITRNGFPEERIDVVVKKSGKVVDTVLQEAEAGTYAVVAVGRVGKKKGMLQNWLVGSRSMKLLEHIEKATLWVSK